jgi:hypothetical protein
MSWVQSFSFILSFILSLFHITLFYSKMKLSLLVAAFSAVFYTVSADAGFSSNTLMKRGNGFPYATLPSTTCTTPSTCSHIDQPVTCRCSNELTTCMSSAGDYCWSTPLTSTSCTSIPLLCSTAFTGIGTVPTCFCGSQITLCVGNAGDYCYFDKTPSLVATSSTVASGSATSSAAAANPTVDTAGSRSDANSNANAKASTTASSGSEQISSKLWITAGCAVLAYAAIH